MSSHLDQLFDHLRYRSVSTKTECNDETRACGQFLANKFDQMGLTSEIHETPGHPVIIGRSQHKADRPTVLIYGHYDVQPEEPIDEWDTPPFEPTLIDGRIFCRGATDNKGQHFAHILGVDQALQKNGGDLPANIIFLIEGEEEIGSPNLAPFLEAKKAHLASDICAVSDTGMIAPGTPTLTYGLRGISCLEFTIHGPSLDLHSGVYGGAIANPALIAARLVASLHDQTGRIQIDHFYDKVEPLADWERKMWAELPDGDAATLAETGAPGLWGEHGYTALEQRWGRPTAEVNGIGGGWQGEGSKTVIGREALVKLSFRLVPHQDPQEIIQLAANHLRKHCPEAVVLNIEEGHYGPAYVMDPHSNYGKAAQNALRKTFHDEPRLIREGGSIPIIQDIKDILGIDSLMLGLALPDCQIHAPNENFTVENFEAGIQLNQTLLEELANV